MNFLEAWSGKVDRFWKQKTGIITCTVGGAPYEVYFDTSVLRIDGKKCSTRGHIHNYIAVGNLLHFSAEKLRKPNYVLGINVWYKAYMVWKGPKPLEFEEDSSSSEYENIGPDDPELYDEIGEVVKIVGRSMAILKSRIVGNRKPVLVAVDRCRLYVDGLQCVKNIARFLQLGEKIHYEAFQMKTKHPSGIEYLANLAWKGWRPNVDVKKPVHALTAVPPEPLFPPPEPAAVAGPSSASEANRQVSHKGINTQPEQLLEQAEPPIPGLVGIVVALPNMSTAVVKSEIDGKPALIALERCRFYINKRNCPDDIKTALCLGKAVRFEAVPIGNPHPCGVEYRTSLAWLGTRPSLNLTPPSHRLDLPQELSINLLSALLAGIL